MNERSARFWCETFSRRLMVDHIRRNGAAYLDRYYAAGWSPVSTQSGPAIFLHHFVASDALASVHSHPWDWSASVILVGGYREQRCMVDGTQATREYRPGDVNVLLADDKHRIDLLGDDCWTLFLAGNYAKNWRFEPSC